MDKSYPMWPIKWSSLKIPTASHLNLQILLEQEILAWHRRLFINRFTGWGTNIALGKKPGVFVVSHRHKELLLTSLLSTGFTKCPSGQLERSSAPPAEGLPILSPSPQTRLKCSSPHQYKLADTLHQLHPFHTPLEKPTTPTQTHQPRQVKEMYEISTNHCSEDKVVWLSPGTLRLLINYEELLHHLLCSVEQQTCNRDSIETAPVINTKFSLYSATCFYS